MILSTVLVSRRCHSIAKVGMSCGQRVVYAWATTGCCILGIADSSAIQLNDSINFSRDFLVPIAHKMSSAVGGPLPIPDTGRTATPGSDEYPLRPGSRISTRVNAGEWGLKWLSPYFKRYFPQKPFYSFHFRSRFRKVRACARGGSFVAKVSSSEQIFFQGVM